MLNAREARSPRILETNVILLILIIGASFPD